MKRVIFAILCMLLIIIYSCEKDDFCLTNPVTPNLVIRFYDASNEDNTKQVDSLTVWAEGKDSLYIGVSSDSIALPLNTLANNTVYHLSNGYTTLETFTIQYATEEEYISRSCGFRVIFNDILINRDTTEIEDTWITSFTPDTITTINSQENAHIEIFH